MPTSYKDQFYEIDPARPPETGTTLAVHHGTLLDGNEDGLLRPNSKDFIDENHISGVWSDSVVVVEIEGKVREIHGVTLYTETGRSYFTPTDGTVLTKAVFLKSAAGSESKAVSVKQLGPPCFVSGTRIATPAGSRLIEQIGIGDLVLTRDHGAQPVRWAGKRRVAGTGDFAPIRFAAGAMGNARPLLVSPQHRMLVGGWRAELFFGEYEVLVAARHLVNGDTIHRLPQPQVTYHHIMFDRHEILAAEGCWSESFHPGDVILQTDLAIRDELFALFPEADAWTAPSRRVTALPVIAGAQARILGGAFELAGASHIRCATPS